MKTKIILIASALLFSQVAAHAAGWEVHCDLKAGSSVGEKGGASKGGGSSKGGSDKGGSKGGSDKGGSKGGGDKGGSKGGGDKGGGGKKK